MAGLGFGTSGVRGLVADLTDRECYTYTTAFLSHVREQAALPESHRVYIGGDLRSSTERIMQAVATTVRDFGSLPIDCGRIPTPALSYYAFRRRTPSIMVTGSHIPDDRNGIKFNMPASEVLKADEREISQHYQRLKRHGQREALFDASGMLLPERKTSDFPYIDAARKEYLARYVGVFQRDALAGLKVVVYQHSSVARDILPELLERLGAEPIPVARTSSFVPVDTEAVRAEDRRQAREWAERFTPFAIVSTDGDGDRPLLFDEQGELVRGDVVGILTATFLEAEAVVTPVSSSTALERCNRFQKVLRTRIGSPYVIEGMSRAAAEGYRPVVGYEANGGVLQATDLRLNGTSLAALPTRDAIIGLLAPLVVARREGKRVSELVAALPARFTHSDRIQDVPAATCKELLEGLRGPDGVHRTAALCGFAPGDIRGMNETDGVRVTLSNGDIFHIRPSGNAPELRCYTEAASVARAETLNSQVRTAVSALLKLIGSRCA